MVPAQRPHEQELQRTLVGVSGQLLFRPPTDAPDDLRDSKGLSTTSRKGQEAETGTTDIDV